jgi:hypothetical protein
LHPAHHDGIRDTDFDGFRVPMASTELIYAYRWPIGVALIGLLLLSRYIIRRLHARREARQRLGAATGEMQVVTPTDYRRARKQFLASLALLAVIIVVAVLTRFR